MKKNVQNFYEQIKTKKKNIHYYLSDGSYRNIRKLGKSHNKSYFLVISE